MAWNANEGITSENSDARNATSDHITEEHMQTDPITIDGPTPTRQRTSRACDHCNAARRKCDGREPCTYCLRIQSSCGYTRQLKKRGKPAGSRSKKSGLALASLEEDRLRYRLQQASKEKSSVVSASPTLSQTPEAEREASDLPSISRGDEMVLETGFSGILDDDLRMFNMDPMWTMEDTENAAVQDLGRPPFFGSYNSGAQLNILADTETPIISNDTQYREGFSPANQSLIENKGRKVYGIHSFSTSTDRVEDEDADEHNDVSGQEDQTRSRSTCQPFSISRSGALPRAPGIASVSSRPNPKRPTQQVVSAGPNKANSGLKYPVLRDAIALLRLYIPDALSFDLLEAYFETSSTTNSYILPCVPPTVYRKHSFLQQEKPRQSSSVLLVSMLWLSAQTADIPMLNASIARRKLVRRKLLELTIKLLKPLSEVSLDREFLRGLRTHSDHATYDPHEDLGPENSSANALDEIMAYVHLGMVTSAGEFKAASLRWWNVAFALAREAKLYQELPTYYADSLTHLNLYMSTSNSPLDHEPSYRSRNLHDYTFGGHDGSLSKVCEETREERRRAWWFLYTLDRQLSLSYNKPLALLDSECQNLRRPCSDDVWLSNKELEKIEINEGRGPWFECSSPSFFGFFLPLTALLGEITYFVGAQNHPRFGISQNTLLDWKQWEKGISDRLYAYEHSLERLLRPQDVSSLGHCQGPGVDDLLASVPLSAAPIQIRILHAYAMCIVHVLHILLVGKWDALTLLDESESLASSPDFAATISHVVEAAACIDMLLDLDPDAYFMPFYLGIYLLQGSLPLFVVAEQFKTDTAEIVVKACKTMIRAHEAHIVRAPSEYQIAFVSTLRQALNQMQGRMLHVSEISIARQIQLFQRYCWIREGRGLAS